MGLLDAGLPGERGPELGGIQPGFPGGKKVISRQAQAGKKILSQQAQVLKKGGVSALNTMSMGSFS